MRMIMRGCIRQFKNTLVFPIQYYSDCEIECTDVTDAEKLYEIVELVDCDKQYYDNADLMKKYYKTWYKTVNSLEMKEQWTEDTLFKIKREIAKIENKFKDALKVEKVEGKNIFETSNQHEK